MTEPNTVVPRHPGWMLVPADISDQGRQASELLCSNG